MALTDDILAALDAGPLDDIARQHGLDVAQVRDVVEDALPAMLGGLAHNTESDSGAASLAAALGDHAGANPLGDLGSLLTGDLGRSILEHVLGGKMPDVSDAIGSRAGVDSATVQKILAALAPIVMAYLASKVGGGADPGVVKERVQKENEQARAKSPDLGSVLGQILRGL